MAEQLLVFLHYRSIQELSSAGLQKNGARAELQTKPKAPIRQLQIFTTQGITIVAKAHDNDRTSQRRLSDVQIDSLHRAGGIPPHPTTSKLVR